jgi:hypothetical protein
LDLEAAEMAIRTSMHRVGGVFLEKLIDRDNGHRGQRIPCGKGHEAGFVDYRGKEMETILSAIHVNRAYYYCAICKRGMAPKDSDLDIVGTSFSPGLRRLMARVGGKEAFDEGRRDLEELAGIFVTTKAVERISECVGEEIEAVAQRQRKAALSGKIVPIKPIPWMYVEMDGTGVPMVPRETEGHQGKDETGRAKTRELKLGCVFTQTKVDEEGWPVRDDRSTSYVGAIENAEEFGRRIFTEAIKRGSRFAKQIVVIGDGAPWIWNLAALHFPSAIEIVDLYHAREHISELAKVVLGPGSREEQQWTEARTGELDNGDVQGVLKAMADLQPQTEVAKDEIRKAIGYFETNAARMRYSHFRTLGLFVGSGVIEAGCKTIAGNRLKQSGMQWTVRGANAIIALRCCDLSGQWEQYWEHRAA